MPLANSEFNFGVVVLFFVVCILVTPGFSSRHQHTMAHEHHGAAAADVMAMPMFFEASMHTVLWMKSWETTNPFLYIISIACLVALALSHEALVNWRSSLLQALSAKSNGADEEMQPLTTSARDPLPWKLKLFLSALYSLNITTGYLLMLAVMTYNVGYFIAVVVGLGLGYFMFALQRVPSSQASVRSDSCHA